MLTARYPPFDTFGVLQNDDSYDSYQNARDLLTLFGASVP